MASENLYVMLMEKNLKEMEQFFFYLQYNGNEREIADLKYIIDKADPSNLYGDNSHFTLDTEHFITESAAQQHVRLPFGNYHRTFHLCKGKMTFHRYEMDHYDPEMIALKLDRDFYHLRIRDLFNRTIKNKFKFEITPFISEQELVKMIADNTYCKYSTDEIGLFYHHFTDEELKSINSYGVIPKVKACYVKMGESYHIQIKINIQYEVEEKSWTAMERDPREYTVDEPLLIEEISNPV